MEGYQPVRFAHHTENVPEELKTAAHWLCTDEAKVPLVAMRNGAIYAASSTDESTWRNYETTLEAWRAHEWSYAGIGRVFSADEDYAGVDLDDVIDPETGTVAAHAIEIVNRLDSYTEISPSGTGLKTWVKAPSQTRAHVKPGLEVYGSRRYFVVTGRQFGERATVEERDDVLAELISEKFPKVDRDRTAYDGPKRALDLLDYLERANIEIFTEMSDGQAERKFSVKCPWATEHTNGDESGSYAGQYADGMVFYRCWHAHCAHRHWRQFKSETAPRVYLGRSRRAKGRAL